MFYKNTQARTGRPARPKKTNNRHRQAEGVHILAWAGQPGLQKVGLFGPLLSVVHFLHLRNFSVNYSDETMDSDTCASTTANKNEWFFNVRTLRKVQW